MSLRVSRFAILVSLLVVAVGCSKVDTALTVQDIAESGGSTITATQESSGAFMGIYHPDAPFEKGVLKQLREKTKGNIAVMMWFQPWGQSGRFKFNVEAMAEVREEGVVPMISWEPWDPGPNPRDLKIPESEPKYKLSNLLRGDADPYIREWASDVATYGGPIFLRPMHEMNGNWYPWGGTVNGNEPTEFVEVWRHIYRIFEEVGATNVTWVWSINVNGLPREERNRSEVYYPGDEFVDWVGISGFNWGAAESWSKWESFSDVFESTYRRLAEYGKPIMITEFSSVEVGGDKAKWIDETFDAIKSEYPEIRGLVWYDAIDEHRDFRIDSTIEAREIYEDSISEKHFMVDIGGSVGDSH